MQARRGNGVRFDLYEQVMAAYVRFEENCVRQKRGVSAQDVFR
jgi:hypothetical protein